MILKNNVVFSLEFKDLLSPEMLKTAIEGLNILFMGANFGFIVFQKNSKILIEFNSSLDNDFKQSTLEMACRTIQASLETKVTVHYEYNQVGANLKHKKIAGEVCS